MIFIATNPNYLACFCSETISCRCLTTLPRSPVADASGSPALFGHPKENDDGGFLLPASSRPITDREQQISRSRFGNCDLEVESCPGGGLLHRRVRTFEA